MEISELERNVAFVSVVIPVREHGSDIERCIESLENQSYVRSRYEILVVDNNSEDDDLEYLRARNTITVLREKTEGAYLSRNKAILEAKGDLIAFIDSDCIASYSWIEAAVHCLQTNCADFIGGQISFTVTKNSTAAQLWDSISYLDNRKYVKKNSTVVTANSLFKKEVFDSVGFFDERLKSGGDSELCARAKKKKYKVMYCEHMKVSHPARLLSSLLAKSYRIGTGSRQVWIARRKSYLWIVIGTLSLLLPLSPTNVIRGIKSRGKSDIEYPVLKMCLVAYLCRLATFMGVMSSIMPSNDHGSGLDRKGRKSQLSSVSRQKA